MACVASDGWNGKIFKRHMQRCWQDDVHKGNTAAERGTIHLSRDPAGSVDSNSSRGLSADLETCVTWQLTEYLPKGEKAHLLFWTELPTSR